MGSIRTNRKTDRTVNEAAPVVAAVVAAAVEAGAWGATPTAAQEEEASSLREAIASLPARFRAVLHCKYALGMNATQIARELEMSPGNVRVCLHRAIKTLRTRMTP